MKAKFTLLFIVILATLSCEGPEGPVGPQGPSGPQGPPGIVGPAGSDGSIIHAGEGTPGGSLGSPGDYYLDLKTGNLYGPKTSNGWEAPLNLRGPRGPLGPEGPQGPAGEDGEDGKDGADGKDGKDGKDGEDGEDGKNGEDGEDGKDGKDGEDGKDGTDGEDGSQIFAGSGPPDSSLGSIGDYYLNKTGYDLYGPKTASGWGTPINLQGPQGDPGPAGTTNHSVLDNLGADDHTQYVLVDGVRNATDGFAVTGTVGSGVIPAEGAGTRIMWYPGKGAFRAGRVTGSNWNDANVGEFSTATGWQSTASGARSTAMGSETTASGDMSTAMGFGSTASGFASTAMGFTTSARGNSATAMGQNTEAIGISTTTMGQGTMALTTNSISVGQFNDLNRSPLDNVLLVAGNGTSSNTSDRSDALVLNFDGNLWIAGTLTEASDRRLKTDIKPMEENVLEKLSRIKAVRYFFREGTGHPSDEQLGLIAQEVQAYFPELVSEKNDGTLSLSYSKFSAVLLKGLQEQQTEIKVYQTEIETLRSENEAIKTRLTTLEGILIKDNTNIASPAGFAGCLLLLLIAFGGRHIFTSSKEDYEE